MIGLRELKQEIRHKGPGKTADNLARCLESKELSPRDFSIAELCIAFMGQEWFNNLNPKHGRYYTPSTIRESSTRSLREASGDSVSYSHFSNITGQIFFNEIKAAYEAEEFVFSKVVKTVSSNILEQEKVAGISNIGDEFSSIVPEGGEYPVAGVSEDYITVPAKKKRGGIVQVTREGILGDKTGVLLDRCRGVGNYLGLNREKRIIDALIDENGGATSINNGGHRYHWKDVSYGSFQSSTPWVNIKTSNGLESWDNVDAAWQILADITDPYTGEPIMIQPTHIVCGPSLFHTAKRIVSATEVRRNDNASAGTANTEMLSPSPLDNYQILTSRLLKARAATDTDWWFGNPSEAVRYYSVWDIETEEVGANSYDALRRDITFIYKASEMGAAAVVEPRVIVENRA